MKKMAALIFVTLTISVFSFAPIMANSAAALDPKDSINDGLKASGGGEECREDGRKVDCFEQAVRNIVNVLLFIIGIISVIMIIIGGIRYTTSNGDSSQITGAKNTILYAVVGLIVAILAYAIVNFVVRSF
jgi:small-conductance mechanosensitive channel